MKHRDEKYWSALALLTVVILTVIALLSGCSTVRALEPNSLPIEITHVSHLTEHAPFTSNPHSYGYNAVSIGAKWVPLPHLSVSVSEGLILEKRHCDNSVVEWYGSMMGPREVFTGRVVYEVPLK